MCACLPRRAFQRSTWLVAAAIVAGQGACLDLRAPPPVAALPVAAAESAVPATLNEAGPELSDIDHLAPAINACAAAASQLQPEDVKARVGTLFSLLSQLFVDGMVPGALEAAFCFDAPLLPEQLPKHPSPSASGV
jgi:hypothetical protein